MGSLTTKNQPLRAKLVSFSQFQKVRRQGRAVHSGFLRMSCLVVWEEKQAGTMRLGLVTSRKVGNAVVRNRVRRRLREIFRNLQIPSGWWIVITAKPGAARVPFSVLQEECLLLLRKLSIITC